MPTQGLAEFAAAWLAAPTRFDLAQAMRLLALPAIDESMLSACMPPHAADALAFATARQLFAAHQFVELPPRALADARRVFAGLVAAAMHAHAAHATPAQLIAALRPHLDALQAWQHLHVAADAPAVVCGEYSAALQMEVLGFAPWQLAAPLLDVGCGEQAQLVRHLRGLGWNAYGLDRMAPADVLWDGAPPCSTWLGSTLPPATFATIVSHMAFSLHFLHHHVRSGGGGVARRYAETYRHILLAVKPGGQFVYAPSLPFVERSLPQGYSVQHRPLPDQLVGAVDALSRAVGESVAQATCVRRAPTP